MPKRIPHANLEVSEGEKKARNYLEMQKRMGRLYFSDFFLKFDKLNVKGNLLEIGPGPGYLTNLIAKIYSPDTIFGLEYSKGMIKIAEEYTGSKGFSNKINYIQGSVEDAKLIQSLGKFDLIYSTFSLHHWNDPLKAIKNLYESLNENGVIFIFDFRRAGLLYHINIIRGIWESIRASYCPVEIEKILHNLGINNYSIHWKGLYLNFIIRRPV